MAAPPSGKLGEVELRLLLAGAATLASAACLGTGTRQFDAPCREMRGSVAREMLRDAREIPVLDVRTAASRRLTGAFTIPMAELPARIGELERHRATPVVVVGDDGEAGRQACELLAREGFRYVIFVSEGAQGLFAGVRGGPEPGPPPKDLP